MTYVALLRGIGPGNPNMHSAKLKAFFEGLGFTNVHTVISSGNIVFDSTLKSDKALEAKIEKAMSQKLGFSRAAIVRSRADLEKLVKKDPYKGIKDERPNYLLVTFFKSGNPALCSVLDMDDLRTPEFMRDLEKKHGKDITSRTWKTINRILAKMEATR